MDDIAQLDPVRSLEARSNSSEPGRTPPQANTAPPPPCCAFLWSYSSTRPHPPAAGHRGAYPSAAEVQWVPNQGFTIGPVGIRFCPWCGTKLSTPAN